MKHLWKVTLAALLAVSMLLAGCSSDDDSSTGGDTTDTDNGADTDDGGDEAAGPFIVPEEDCDDYQGTQGIEGDTIKLGTIRPAQGNYAIYDQLTQGIEAYFNAANKEGGLKAGDGKSYKIEFLKEDDEYDKDKTPALAQKLVEQDGVFAFIGQIGTEPAKAIRDYMNDKCVPNIALATGSTEWSKANEYPWYIAGLPAYVTEAHAWMTYLKEAKPDAKIALMFQDDDMGEAYKYSIEREIEGSDMEMVAAEGFDVLAGVSSEATVTQLSQTGADVFLIAVGGVDCPKSLTFMPGDWTPMTFVSLTCAVPAAMNIAGERAEGVFQAQATYDVMDPNDADQPAIKEFREKASLGGLSAAQIDGGIAGPGWGFAAFFAQALSQMETVDRATLMNTLYSLKDAGFGMVREGITVNTDGANDPWAIEGFRIVQRQGTEWIEKMPITNWEGKTAEFAGLN